MQDELDVSHEEVESLWRTCSILRAEMVFRDLYIVVQYNAIHNDEQRVYVL